MPITGFRCWDVGWRPWNRTKLELTSPMMKDVWLPGEPMTAAACGWCRASRKRQWPNKDRCSCGIYSFVDPVECVWQSLRYLTEARWILGTVGYWGRTVPHQRGQRSLHAKVTGFFLWPDTPPPVVELLLKFPVPTVQAVDQPWWQPQWLEGYGAWKTWHATKPPEPEKE